MSLYGLDRWLEAPYQREAPMREGDEIARADVRTVAPCSVCGLLCERVEVVSTVLEYDHDEHTGRGGLRPYERCDLDEERTTVATPDAHRSVWVCVVCQGWCDEGDIVRPGGAR
jgi:hypothetical protein